MKRKRHIFLMAAAVLLASMNMRPAITSIAPLLETIQSELQLNSTMISLLTAIPVICMGLFAPLAAKLGTFGMERIIIYCLLLIAIATGLRYIAENAAILLTTALLIGVGLAIAGPSLSGFIKLHFPEQAALMIGLYSAGIGLGASLSAGLTIPLQHQFAYRWPAALAVWALPALLAALLWIFAAKRFTARTANSGQQAKKPFPWKNKRAMLIMFFFGLQGWLHYSITAWIAPIAQANGLTEIQAGSVVTLFTLVQMGASVAVPFLVTRYPRRSFWMMNSSCLMLTGLLLLSLLNNEVVPWISAGLLGYGAGVLFFLALLLPVEETDRAEDANAWTSMVQCGGYTIAGIGPAFTGWVHDATGSYPQAFLGLSVICLFIIALSLVLKDRRSLAR